jgi:cell division protein ZipA
MSDSPWTLRLVLALFGVAVVAGIYLFGLARKRRRNRNYSNAFGRLGSRQAQRFESWSDADDDAASLVEEVGEVRVRKIEPLRELPELRNEPPEPLPVAEAETAPEPEEDTPKPRARRKRKRETQLDLALPAAEPEQAPPSAPPPAPPEPTLLLLYLRPRQQELFSGPAIVRNLNAVGMRHGDMRIFHHFGTEELRCKTPLFSVANMLEPGYFDLNRIEAFRTSGLVMFLQLPAELDGPVAFELFLNAAQRLAEGLRADLWTTPDTALEVAAVEAMRTQAGAFARKRRGR